MSRKSKLLAEFFSGKHDSSILFTDLQKILNMFGFKYRVKGSHHIYYMEHIFDIINIQSVKNFAKDYQVKQIRNIILKYNLEVNINE